MPLPAAPIYPPPEGLAAGRYAPPPAIAAPGAPWAAEVSASLARVPAGARGSTGFSAGGAPVTAASIAAAAVEAAKERPRDPKHTGVGPDITISLPDARDRFIIDTLADYVSVDGTDFEQASPRLVFA